jgi:transcriptional regulator with XRE-family HTH domain
MSVATSAIDHQPEVASVSEAAGTARQVGSRIRALREAMGMSLRDLAERCGVSAPMLSQVERGETSPTLAVAAKVAEGLELTLSQLLRLDEADHVVVIRAKERRRSHHAGHRVEELTPPLPGQRADVSLHSLEPGGSTGAAGETPIHEPGSRETAVVLTGAVTLVIDGQSHHLDQGDSVTFDADLAHHFTNQKGERPTTFIAVVSAGLRRS